MSENMLPTLEPSKSLFPERFCWFFSGWLVKIDHMPFAEVLHLCECSGRPFHMVDLNVTGSGELFKEEFYVWTTNIGRIIHVPSS